MSENPYDPPAGPTPSAGPQPGQCPSCQSSDFRQLKFTWWGGALGPKLLNHVKCNSCGTSFNSGSGKSNNTAIAIYSVVVLAICIVIFVLLRGL